MLSNGRKRFARMAAVLLLIAALATASLSCGDKQAAEPSFDEATQQQIEKIITDAMAAENIPGVIAGVWVDGRGTWTGALGTADTATGEAMQVDKTVRIASNTKTYTATLILQLAGEGKLSLDDPLSKYVTGIPNGDRITVRQLLDMTSGIYSYSEDEEFGRVFDSEPLKVWTAQEIMDIVLRHEPDFEPGAGWHYSDTNYYLLGMIAEQITGTPVEEEIKRGILDRLGLKQTWFPTGPDMPGDYAHGYMPAADYETSKALVEMTRIDPSAPWTGGAMISSLEDLKTYVRALADGSLLTPEMQEERLRMVQVPDNVLQYGLGIASVFGFLGHTGAINGFNSVIFHNPDLKATIVVITNKSTNASGEAVGIFDALCRLLFPDLFTPAPKEQ
ncbi:MAG: beta-lactamase family protein [Actinobacteria bacterium]|nr:beta-lactamase family protein [Actinomycetota bacterium]